MIYTMMQVCRKTNLTYQALKFYCNQGLIPHVKRDQNNRQVFGEHDVKWIQDLVCLKAGGTTGFHSGSCLKNETGITPTWP